MKPIHRIGRRLQMNISLYTHRAFTTTSIKDVGGLALGIGFWKYGYREHWNYTFVPYNPFEETTDYFFHRCDVMRCEVASTNGNVKSWSCEHLRILDWGGVVYSGLLLMVAFKPLQCDR
jgi:hypothetical protein